MQVLINVAQEINNSMIFIKFATYHLIYNIIGKYYNSVTILLTFIYKDWKLQGPPNKILLFLKINFTCHFPILNFWYCVILFLFIPSNIILMILLKCVTF